MVPATSCSFFRSGLRKFAIPNRLKGTDKEYREVMRGIIAGFGTYTVDGNSVSITWVASSYPNRVGAVEKRTYKIDWAMPVIVPDRSQRPLSQVTKVHKIRAGHGDRYDASSRSSSCAATSNSECGDGDPLGRPRRSPGPNVGAVASDSAVWPTTAASATLPANPMPARGGALRRGGHDIETCGTMPVLERCGVADFFGAPETASIRSAPTRVPLGRRRPTRTHRRRPALPHSRPLGWAIDCSGSGDSAGPERGKGGAAAVKRGGVSRRVRRILRDSFRSPAGESRKSREGGELESSHPLYSFTAFLRTGYKMSRPDSLRCSGAGRVREFCDFLKMV